MRHIQRKERIANFVKNSDATNYEKGLRTVDTFNNVLGRFSDGQEMFKIVF